MSGSRREREARPSSETVHHIVKAEVSALQTEVSALDTKVDALDTKVDALQAEMSSMNEKLEKILSSMTMIHA